MAETVQTFTPMSIAVQEDGDNRRPGIHVQGGRSSP